MFNLVAPLGSSTPTAMRSTDTAGQLGLFEHGQAASGAVDPLIDLPLFAGLRRADVDSANDRSAPGGADWAWYQGFDDGGQGYYDKDNELRARAVRRVPI